MKKIDQTAILIQQALIKLSNADKAIQSQRFFKTGKGEYGEGDLFRGISVPQQRLIAKGFQDVSTQQTILDLLASEFHEDRLVSIFLLNHKFKKDFKKGLGEEWVELYLENTSRINNWDLVDSSAYFILGPWLENKNRAILYQLANENCLWKNRIAIVSTLHFIRKKDFSDTFKIAKILLNHKHDLIHKAVGWMLKEAWKQSPDPVEIFLQKYVSQMPRTMLRFAIEKMPASLRREYMRIR